MSNASSFTTADRFEEDLRRVEAGPFHANGELFERPCRRVLSIGWTADLVYQDFYGERTGRRFTCRAIIQQDGLAYFEGLCHVRHETRTFRVDRVVSLTCPVTGEMLMG